MFDLGEEKEEKEDTKKQLAVTVFNDKDNDNKTINKVEHSE